MARNADVEGDEPEEAEDPEREDGEDRMPEEESKEGPDETSFDSFATEFEVERVNGGDPRAMDRLFFRLRSMVLAEIRDHPSYPYLPPTHSAEDVLQDLWTSIFARGSLRRFSSRGRGSFRAYLRQIISRLLISIIRKGSADKRGGGEPPEPLAFGDSTSMAFAAPPAHGPGPSTVVAYDDQLERWKRILHGIEREVWVLAYIEGYSYKEIADKLGKSEAAVRSAYHRALWRLRDSGLFDEGE